MSDRMEANTRRKLVNPKLEKAGWDQASDSVSWEYEISQGEISFNGVEYEHGDNQYADYALMNECGSVVYAVVEAKREGLNVMDGRTQAIIYAARTGTPIAYTTNGHEIAWGIVGVDDKGEGKIIKEFEKIEAFHSPNDLKKLYYQYKGFKPEVDDFSVLEAPFSSHTGYKPRYYQTKAINNTLEHILNGDRRVLIAMATGTGKTYTAAQLVYKILKQDSDKKILFLVDRTILRQNAYDEFGIHFSEEEIFEIEPKVRFTTHRNIYFGIYQTLSAKLSDSKYVYENIEDDFFDYIIIDECHRGQKQVSQEEDDVEGEWYKLLNYFSKSIHIGLTATPKREESNDTYSYFNNNIALSYSVREGVRDGYLAPYFQKTRKTNKDEDGIIIEDGQFTDQHGQPVPGRTYSPSEFNRLLVVPELIRVYVKDLLEHLIENNIVGKTLIFCIDQEHAQDVARIMNEEFQNYKDIYPRLKSYTSDYAARITGEERDSKGNYPLLEKFKKINTVSPTVVTTSKLLTTGVNIPTLTNVVFMRQVNSLVEFKQMMGRGTRIFDKENIKVKKKMFFMIAYGNSTLDHLDVDWDAPPLEITSSPSNIIRDPGPPGERIKYHMSDDFLSGNIFITEKEEYITNSNGERVTYDDYIVQQKEILKELLVNSDGLINKFTSPSSYALFLHELKEERVNIHEIIKYFREQNNILRVDVFEILKSFIFNDEYKNKYGKVDSDIYESSWYDALPKDWASAVSLLLKSYCVNDSSPFVIDASFFALPELNGAGDEHFERVFGIDKFDEIIDKIWGFLYAK